MSAGRGAFRGPGLRTPSRLEHEFDVGSLGGHFVLRRSSEGTGPPGWRQFEGSGWALFVGPDLPALDLRLENGDHAGWLVGHPIDLGASAFLDSTVVVPDDVAASGSPVDLDTWLHAFGGRFAAIILRPFLGVLPDSYGALPVFYSAAAGVLASNPFLVCDAGGTVVDSPLVEELRVDETGVTFSLGMTPFDGIEYVLPNHCLDLTTWASERTWPLTRLPTTSVEVAVETVGDVVSSTISAAASAGHASMSVTAGGDTRTLLACARGVIDQLRLFTIAFPDDLGSVDLRWAPRIAERAGVRHETVPWIEPTNRDECLYMYRTGCMGGERRGRRAGPSLAQLGGHGPYILGVGGDMLHGLETKPGDEGSERIAPSQLLRRLAKPHHPQFTERIERWMEGLPPLDVPQIVTLAELELAESSWGASFTLGYSECATVMLYPFTHRRVFAALLSVPAAERRADLIRTGVIRSRWPELLDVPFNKITLPIALRRRRLRLRNLAVGAFSRVKRRDFRRS